VSVHERVGHKLGSEELGIPQCLCLASSEDGSNQAPCVRGAFW
jgi:hypothetical protein